MNTKKETTTCYKCDTEVQAFVGQVHPLCEECDTEFSGWLESQLRLVN